MDDFSDTGFPENSAAEAYNDILPYDDEQVPPLAPEVEPVSGSLADRIGHTKVYLLSESSAARVGKVRW
jgi:hypothetical protein